MNWKRLAQANYDCLLYDCLTELNKTKCVTLKERLNNKLLRLLKKGGTVYPFLYDEYVEKAVQTYKKLKDVTPCIDPDFDHSPRSMDRGIILHDSTPQKWGNFLSRIKEIVMSRENANNLLFIKAWNEWGEGNYLEPDRKWGKAYIEETAKALK